MAPSPTPAPAGFSRRALLASSVGLALLAAGCTAGSSGAGVGTEEADRLAEQVAVQEAVVAAYALATTADPALALSDLAAQATEQLERLRAAAPSPGTPSAAASTAGAAPPSPPPGADVRTWLREQVAVAAEAHARAAVAQTGARAALLGSIAAGLRGHEAALA
ncbi:hypothetical protein E4P41_12485 [Geodermatophilus sp. DF01-2]|uniref:hypothetical protein n=1 Tax=Geodermatophilus sp. DF01-2 TaxID=2559610 RepID=UPI001073A662|nr:hypothetical protein [Geodermatophilus sp. DF01_2]TFV58763.1 hypothetical protein E4P41_12485 [Geodermatophilus sp. DF01_2]